MRPMRTMRTRSPLARRATSALVSLAAALAIVAALTAPSVANTALSEGDLHIEMGIYYQLWDMRSAAQSHFREAFEKTSSDPEVALIAAVAAYSGRDFSSALQWLKQIQKSSAVYPIALSLEGAVYLKQISAAYTGSVGLRPDGLYAAAEQRLTEALALRGDLAFAKHMLARIYAARGQSQKATLMLREIPDADRIDAVSELLSLLLQR